jgi:thiol:disulfide interchange protein DsbD
VEFLPAKEAFNYTIETVQRNIIVRYEIAPGYYLYRDKLSFSTDTAGVSLGTPVAPNGNWHVDEFFGRQEIYRGTSAVTVPVQFTTQPSSFDLKLRLQGCADAGLCYPPQSWTTKITMLD